MEKFHGIRFNCTLGSREYGWIAREEDRERLWRGDDVLLRENVVLAGIYISTRETLAPSTENFLGILDEISMVSNLTIFCLFS